MLLPRNGRIVVIDDKPEDVLPLLKSLWKNGFGAIHFSGKKEELPCEPLDDVRVIFLDMELETGGYTGSNDKTKAATTARVLKSIVNTNKNSAYLIIMWAIHTELMPYFWEYINRDSNCHFIHLAMDKAKCKSSGYDLEIIVNEIGTALRNNDAFSFFVNWENIIHKSSNDIILDFSSFFPQDTEWNKKILGILKKLAEEYAGKTLDTTDHEQIVKNSMCAFNGTFTDTLENNIAQIASTGISFNSISPVSDSGIIAKINTKLILDQNNTLAKPGSVYMNSGKDCIQDYFNTGSNLSGIEKVFCEISPTCDYAQKKWMYHRILSGVKIKPEQERYVRKKNAEQLVDYFYKTPVFDIGEQAAKFVFDLRKLESKNLGELDALQPICTFRHDLLVDIQHKVASHSSRPGMLSL